MFEIHENYENSGTFLHFHIFFEILEKILKLRSIYEILLKVHEIL